MNRDRSHAPWVNPPEQQRLPGRPTAPGSPAAWRRTRIRRRLRANNPRRLGPFDAQVSHFTTIRGDWGPSCWNIVRVVVSCTERPDVEGLDTQLHSLVGAGLVVGRAGECSGQAAARQDGDGRPGWMGGWGGVGGGAPPTARRRACPRRRRRARPAISQRPRRSRQQPVGTRRPLRTTQAAALWLSARHAVSD